MQSLSNEDCGQSNDCRGTLIPKWSLRILKNSTEAIVFGQLVYWLKRGNPPIPKRGLALRWVAKNAPDLAAEIHRQKHEVNRALLSLRKHGFVTWETRKFGGENCRHISIDWWNVADAYQTAIKNRGEAFTLERY